MKNKDGVEVKNGQLWMSLDKSRPMRVCRVSYIFNTQRVELRNIATGSFSSVAISKLYNHSKGWKLIGTAL